MQRLIDNEVFQMAMLQWLGSKRFLGSLTFGEGTMLRLCHELPRYSRNMDFWFFKEEDYENYYNRLYNALLQEPHVSDARNNSSSIVMEVQKEGRMPKLKIEIHKTTAPLGSSEEKIAFSSHFPAQVLVRGFTLWQMLKKKVLAFIDSGEIVHAFDLEFLVRKGVALHLSEKQRGKVMRRLTALRKEDFEVKLGDILLPELREYYKKQGFSHLQERLSLGQ